LTTAGLTTPEFQLTADTSVAQQMNFLYNGFLNGNSGNTNGFSSFNNGSGAMVLDIGRWMTPAFTSNANIPTLVYNLNSLLCAAVRAAAVNSTIRDLRIMNAAVAQSNISDYNALVCIFLSGSNDSNNLIIPTIQPEYNNYASIRGDILQLPLSGYPANQLVI